MTFCSTAHVVVQLGATPVLVDTNEDLVIDAAHIERAITSRTKAVIPVHYAGYPCDLWIQSANWPLVMAFMLWKTPRTLPARNTRGIGSDTSARLRCSASTRPRISALAKAE